MRQILFAVVAFVAGMFFTSAYADDSASNPWQGEWLSAERGSNIAISIGPCGINGKCAVLLYKYSTEGRGAYCFRHANMEFHDKRADVSSNDCKFGKCQEKLFYKFTLASQGLKVTRMDLGAQPGGTTCTPVKNDEKRIFKLMSPINYRRIPGTSGVECYARSRSVQALCTDGELTSLIVHAMSIPFVRMDYFWIMDKHIFNKCDKNVVVKDCLSTGYNKKISILESKSKKNEEIYGYGGSASKAEKILRSLSGVYRHRFPNGNASGDKYISEDKLEIVPVSNVAAYIRMRTNFFNGHRCDVAGIVDYRKIGGFVYQDDDSEDSCLLTLRLEGRKITFDDPNRNCSKFCGARGFFGGELFNIGQRQKIKNMSAILRSADYKKAIDNYKEKSSDRK